MQVHSLPVACYYGIYVPKWQNLVIAPTHELFNEKQFEPPVPHMTTYNIPENQQYIKQLDTKSVFTLNYTDKVNVFNFRITPPINYNPNHYYKFYAAIQLQFPSKWEINYARLEVESETGVWQPTEIDVFKFKDTGPESVYNFLTSTGLILAYKNRKYSFLVQLSTRGGEVRGYLNGLVNVYQYERTNQLTSVDLSELGLSEEWDLMDLDMP